MTRRLTPEQDLERLLDEDAGEFGAIYARLSRPEPPRRLDRVVLANAARAVHGGRAPRAQRWALAMGSVTGVVLAAGIAWQVGQQMESRDSVPDGSQRMQDTRVVPVEAISEPKPRKKAQADLIMRDSELTAEAKQSLKKVEEPSDKQDRPASPPPPNAAAPAAAYRTSAPKSPGALGESVQSQPTAAANTQMEPEAFPAESDAATVEPGSLQESVQEKAKESRSRAAGSAAKMESRSAVAERQPAAAAPSPAETPLNRNQRLPPDAWLVEIERLADIGRRDEAIENLRAFRTLYPDWPLSDALRQLEP